MRALTLIQPWAYAVTHHGKRIENRVKWPVARLRSQTPDVWALHAGLKYDGDVRRVLVARGLEVPDPGAIGAGIVAVCVTADVVGAPGEVFPPFNGDQLAWYMGYAAILIREVHRLDRPVPCRGMLGFWTLPDAVRAEVVAQVSSTVAAQITAAESRGKP